MKRLNPFDKKYQKCEPNLEDDKKWLRLIGDFRDQEAQEEVKQEKEDLDLIDLPKPKAWVPPRVTEIPTPHYDKCECIGKTCYWL